MMAAGNLFDLLDVEKRYEIGGGASGVELVCPADLLPGDLAEMQRIAARAFEAIGGAGLARVDFFFTGEGFVLNEINTMPGFTPTSVYGKLWAESGLAYPDLVDELCRIAVARFASERAYRH